MAFTRAQTPALTQAAAYTDEAHQQFTTHLNRLQTLAATHVNQPGTWATQGAGVMQNALQAYHAEYLKVLQLVDNIKQNLTVSHGHYTNAVADDAATVARFSAMLNS